MKLAIGTLIIQIDMKRPIKGYTLIELLIVILIISIVAGIALITTNPNQRKSYEMVATHFKNLFQLAEQEALLRNVTLGFSLTHHGYQFLQLQINPKTQQTSWQPYTANTLSAHSLPANMDIKITTQRATSPQIMFLPSGETNPFTIYIGKKNNPPFYQVTGKTNGEIISEASHASEE